MHIFINSIEDMRWLREVHLPDLPAEYLSAVIYGNEDNPEEIETYKCADPHIGDEYTLWMNNGDNTYCWSPGFEATETSGL